MDFSLGAAEDGDMDLVTFTKDICVRSLCTVGGTENVHGGAGEQGVTVNVIACGRRYVIIFKGLLQSFFSRGLPQSGLGNLIGRFRLTCRDGYNLRRCDGLR